MPEQMSEEQIEEIIDDVISEVGATSIRDLGRVMKKPGAMAGQDALIDDMDSLACNRTVMQAKSAHVFRHEIRHGPSLGGNRSPPRSP